MDVQKSKYFSSSSFEPGEVWVKVDRAGFQFFVVFFVPTNEFHSQAGLARNSREMDGSWHDMF